MPNGQEAGRRLNFRCKVTAEYTVGENLSPPIDNTTLEILKVIEMAWQNPFTTKSKYARKNADIVGIALEEGLITLIVTPVFMELNILFQNLA